MRDQVPSTRAFVLLTLSHLCTIRDAGRLRAYLLDTWIERLKMDSADTKMDSSNHKAKRQMDMATFMTDFSKLA